MGHYYFLYLVLSPLFFECRFPKSYIYWVPCEATMEVDTWQVLIAEEKPGMESGKRELKSQD